MWQSLKQEASQSSNYLGKELHGFLVVDVQGQEMEVKTKALEQYPDQKARPDMIL